MSTPGIPVYQREPDGSERVVAHISLLACADCGALTPVADMLHCRETGEWHCVRCNGSEYDPYRSRRKAVAR